MDPKETSLYTAIVLSGVIICFFIIFFIVSIIRQQRRILELSRKNILAEMTAMEKERARIANDMHDDLGPIMSITKFQVDSLTVTDEEEKVQQQQALEHLDNLITRMREISNDLMPHILLQKGLWPSLQEFVRKTQRSSGIKIQLELLSKPTLSREMEINLYRIIQEIVHNMVKHAGATLMELRVEEKGKAILVTCRDNGKGFDYEKALKERKGLGISSIQNRVVLLKGSLFVESRPGRGTAYQLSLPL